MEISYRSISLKYESEEGEQIFCKGSGEDYLYTISYKAVGDQIEKVSLWFSEKQLLENFSLFLHQKKREIFNIMNLCLH